MPSRPAVAVIGSGVSGLTAAYLLQRTAAVTLYEADTRPGGHAHTHDVRTADGRVIPIDSGFIVHNDRTYPNLLRLFAELGVETQPTDMTMSVRCDGCGLEYAGASGLGGLFAEGRQAFNPTYLRMLAEVKLFHRRARALLADPNDRGATPMTLQQFLERGAYSRYFVTHFMIPVVSCVWSCPPQTALRYPARYLFTFLNHHGMLTVTGKPKWRTVTGGSRRYVERIVSQVSATALGRPVRAVRRVGDGVEVTDAHGETRTFAQAVVATHADQALTLLAEPTDAERRVLGAFTYSENETVMHTDASLLPRAPRARAAWNYLLDQCDSAASAVRVSYSMNRLHRLAEAQEFLVTLNPGALPEGAVIARMRYTHPVYTVDALAAQAQLPSLNDGRLAFAGAYHGWGFHEDGCLSGVRAAEALGVRW